MSTTFTPVTDSIAAYIESLFSSEDQFLKQLRAEAELAGIPPIHISGAQGAVLQVLLQAINARRVLEIGSLAGYSAITIGRVLPLDGRLVCLEINPDYCRFIERQIHRAGLEHIITVQCGRAADLIAAMPAQPLFDAVFIDADKPNYPLYLELCYERVRVGGLIIADNTLAWGSIADPETTFEPENVQALREYNNRVANHPGLRSALLPTGDGLTVALKYL